MQDRCIKLILNGDGCNEFVELNTKRNWIKSIVYSQKMDEGGYGARFSVIPPFLARSTDTRCLWILSGMLVCVKEVWKRTDQCAIVFFKLAWLVNDIFNQEMFSRCLHSSVSLQPYQA